MNHIILYIYTVSGKHPVGTTLVMSFGFCGPYRFNRGNQNHHRCKTRSHSMGVPPMQRKHQGHRVGRRRHKAVVGIKLTGAFIRGMHQQCSHPDVLSHRDGALQRILQQGATDVLALQTLIDGQSRGLAHANGAKFGCQYLSHLTPCDSGHLNQRLDRYFLWPSVSSLEVSVFLFDAPDGR